MATVIIILVFRLTSIASEKIYSNSDPNFNTLAIPATSAVLELSLILILNYFYERVAIWLTEKELHRTQNEYDDNLTLKIYTFQFINYYAGFFYIAFIKGRIVGHPGGYHRYFDKRLEECNPGGCLMELCIQLAIVMIGDQLWGAFIEYGYPYIQKYINRCKVKYRCVNKSDEETQVDGVQMDLIKNDDYLLQEWDVRGLFDEYLEMGKFFQVS